MTWGRARWGVWLAAGVSIALAVLVALPVLVVFLGAGLPPSAIGLGSASTSVETGLAAVAYLLEQYGAWLALSGQVALLCVAIGLALALPAAYAIVCHPFRGARWLEELVLLPLSLPGIALSAGLLAAYPGARGGSLVIAGHLLYTLPFTLRVATAALRAADISALEAAARSLGAGLGQRLAWVVLPQLRHAAVLGALLVFTVSWGEFNVSYLLNSGQPQTFPAALYNTYANESIERSSAATAIFLAGALPALLAIQWVGGEADARAEQGA